MFTSVPRRVTRLSVGASLRRTTIALATITSGVLAWAATVRPHPPQSSQSRARALVTGSPRPRCRPRSL